SLRNLGRNEEALISIDKSLELKYDDYYSWKWRGIVLSELDKYEEALTSLNKALEFKLNDDLSDLYYVWKWRSIIFNKLGQYEEQLISIDKALEFEINDDFHYACYDRGIALKNLGRNEEAIASYDKALEFKPDLHEAWNKKACCYALQGNIEQALENLQQAINLNPDKYRESAKTNSDFDNIRHVKRFQSLIQG
ncbi:MAG: tetratricopeptide repeat protein, partial [Nostoc sp. TH1S01]|nr:tetratricopeptide repeat protein [Nostoc sp. TH1S01]